MTFSGRSALGLASVRRVLPPPELEPRLGAGFFGLTVIAATLCPGLALGLGGRARETLIMALLAFSRDNAFSSSSSSSSKEGLARRLALSLAALVLAVSTTSSSSSSHAGPRFPVRGGFGRVRVTARFGRLTKSSVVAKGSSSAPSVDSPSSSIT